MRDETCTEKSNLIVQKTQPVEFNFKIRYSLDFGKLNFYRELIKSLYCAALYKTVELLYC